MNGCKKTRITRMFSHERFSGPMVFFEKLLPLGLSNVKPYFSSENKHSEGRCAGHRLPGCRGGVSQVWAFFVGETCLFQIAGALQAGLLLNENMLSLGFGYSLRTSA